MRILIHSINFSPELTGIGKYTGEMAEWLAAHGHDVRVVTAPPYYPQWRIAEGYSAWWYRREIFSGADRAASQVVVFRCPLWVPARPSGLRRLLHLASFTLSSLPVMLWQVSWRPALMLTIEPPLFCAPQSLLVARLSGADAWLHVQDFEVDAAIELGLLPAGPLRAGAGLLERWLMRRFDCVSTVSRHMLDGLTAKGVARSRQVYFPNWVDTDIIFPLEGRSPMRAELGIPPEAVVVLYAGNMGAKQGLELLMDAADQLKEEKNIRFVLCGDGAVRNSLQVKVKQRALPNVTFLPLQPMDKLNELLNLADIHALIQKEEAGDLVLPSKLTGMMASGRPVVATALNGTALGDMILASGGGKLVPPEDATSLAKELRMLANAPEERAALGEHAREYAVQHMSKKKILEDMAQHLPGLG